MARLLGLTRGETAEPREITRTIPTSESIGESGWLIRFFDSAFFCEWIAVSYLYKHDHAGVRDYLCNRMYTLPLSGIESYMFQICYMMVHKPSPSLDKFVIDMCTKSLKIALKVHWFLMAELEDIDDNEGISRIQEKCQIAATLMGEWPPLIKPQNSTPSPTGKNQMLNRLLSSKQRLLSLTSSPPAVQRSMSFSPNSVSLSQQDDNGGSKISTPEENKIFKKLIPGPKVRDALLFRKSAEKEDDSADKDSFFKRLLRDSRDEDSRKASVDRDDEESEKDSFFKRLLRDSRDEDGKKLTGKDEDDSEKDGFFKRLLSSSRDEDARKSVEKDEEESEKDGFFRRLLSSSKDDEEEVTTSSDGFFKRIFRDSKNDVDDKASSKSVEDDENEGFFRKIFKERSEDKKDGSEKNEYVEKAKKFSEDDDKDGFFKKFFKEKFEDKKEGTDKIYEDGRDDHVNGEEEEPSDFSLFRRLFRVHPEDSKVSTANENNISGNLHESSPGTENFFRKLFKDRDRSVEDSELFGSKRNKEKRPGSPKQHDKPTSKPPLPNNGVSQIRKGAYHESLEFVQSLCDTSYGLVDVFPIEDRKSALCESLGEINAHVATAQNSGGVCFPMGKGMYRVVHIPEDEAVLLNSREKAPYLICVEVLKCETPSLKDAPNMQKLSKGGIPLANGDVFLQKPPPWACPVWNGQDMYHSGYDSRMSRSTSQAIDQAMTQFREAKVKFVRVNLSLEMQSDCMTDFYKQNKDIGPYASKSMDDCGLEWVRVTLTSEPGVSMDDIVDQEPPRRKEHRRVPSTVAIEEVKAAALKGEAPPGLPLKGAGQDSDAQPKVPNGGLPNACDALSGELWEVKKERIRKASVYGKLPGWDLRSVIVKSGDDCRQEHLAVQLISHFYDIFQEAGLPLWLRPYEVLVTSSYTALIETIPDTASIHSIKNRFSNITSLREFFVAKYQENSPTFKLAQRNFVESMAGYSLVCYLLQVKDRHNGNLLLDEEGHIIHIDFGFMLSNSPGGVNFESAPFKLTRELLEVMDSDAEGVPSEFFDYFKVLCIQGFLTCRKHAERIILLVEMLQDSGFPCFKGGPRTIQNLRKRFHLSLTEEQCVSLVLSLISSSLDAWRTRQYDYYQRVLNGIL
nr:phosphatidylinositol 4-kinase beta 1-like isoform X1 [Ipomoea batatas]